MKAKTSSWKCPSCKRNVGLVHVVCTHCGKWRSGSVYMYGFKDGKREGWKLAQAAKKEEGRQAFAEGVRYGVRQGVKTGLAVAKANGGCWEPVVKKTNDQWVKDGVGKHAVNENWRREEQPKKEKELWVNLYWAEGKYHIGGVCEDKDEADGKDAGRIGCYRLVVRDKNGKL
jgi:hypothetical protein